MKLVPELKISIFGSAILILLIDVFLNGGKKHHQLLGFGFGVRIYKLSFLLNCCAGAGWAWRGGGECWGGRQLQALGCQQCRQLGQEEEKGGERTQVNCCWSLPVLVKLLPTTSLMDFVCFLPGALVFLMGMVIFIHLSNSAVHFMYCKLMCSSGDQTFLACMSLV